MSTKDTSAAPSSGQLGIEDLDIGSDMLQRFEDTVAQVSDLTPTATALKWLEHGLQIGDSALERADKCNLSSFDRAFQDAALLELSRETKQKEAILKELSMSVARCTELEGTVARLQDSNGLVSPNGLTETTGASSLNGTADHVAPVQGAGFVKAAAGVEGVEANQHMAIQSNNQLRDNCQMLEKLLAGSRQEAAALQAALDRSEEAETPCQKAAEQLKVAETREEATHQKLKEVEAALAGSRAECRALEQECSQVRAECHNNLVEANKIRKELSTKLEHAQVKQDELSAICDGLEQQVTAASARAAKAEADLNSLDQPRNPSRGHAAALEHRQEATTQKSADQLAAAHEKEAMAQKFGEMEAALAGSRAECAALQERWERSEAFTMEERLAMSVQLLTRSAHEKQCLALELEQLKSRLGVGAEEALCMLSALESKLEQAEGELLATKATCAELEARLRRRPEQQLGEGEEQREEVLSQTELRLARIRELEEELEACAAAELMREQETRDLIHELEVEHEARVLLLDEEHAATSARLLEKEAYSAALEAQLLTLESDFGNVTQNKLSAERDCRQLQATVEGMKLDEEQFAAKCARWEKSYHDACASEQGAMDETAALLRKISGLEQDMLRLEAEWELKLVEERRRADVLQAEIVAKQDAMDQAQEEQWSYCQAAEQQAAQLEDQIDVMTRLRQVAEAQVESAACRLEQVQARCAALEAEAEASSAQAEHEDESDSESSALEQAVFAVFAL